MSTKHTSTLKLTCMTIAEWIRDREIRGRVTFSIDDIRHDFPNIVQTTLKSELQRLTKKMCIKSVSGGFYVIIPPQYALKGVVPPTYYIDRLMNWKNKPYYICLLSAAAIHGAGHQRAIVTNVMTIPPKAKASNLNPLIQWNYRQQIPSELLIKKNTEMGITYYSSPELTAVDLIQFADHIGGYQRAATVLSELIDVMDVEKLAKCFPYTTTATIQRLGYIIEFILEEKDKADILYQQLKESKATMNGIKMRNDVDRRNDNPPTRWRVNMNISIEVDDI